ncbi:MAG: hypothetical protein ACOC2H_02025 [Spirochaetota bacterium]
MRSRATNILQLIVLVTGLFYMVFGMLYLFMPELFTSLFNIDLNSEWSNQIKIDDYLSMLYIFSRCFAILLIFIGFEMVLPLYDPVRYRELIYFNGVFFPVVMSAYMALQFFLHRFDAPAYAAFIFSAVFMLNLIGLFLTKGQNRRGIK